MRMIERIAKNLRDVHAGPNWTAASVAEKLDDVNWKEAATRLGSLHTIAELVFHVNYYVEGAITVLNGETLVSSDAESFECPTVASDEDWSKLIQRSRANAETLARLIESLPDARLSEYFVDEASGTNYECLVGRIEHAYYHLGQVSIIKTLLRDRRLCKLLRREE